MPASHPAAGAARARPRGLVRPGARRRRTFRAASPRHDHAVGKELHTASMVELYEKTGGNIIALQEWRSLGGPRKYGIVGWSEGAFRFRSDGNGREAGQGHGAIELLTSMAATFLQPEIFDIPRDAGARRRQRDPADGRHAEAGGHAEILRIPLRRTHLRLRIARRVRRGECRDGAGRARISPARYRPCCGASSARPATEPARQRRSVTPTKTLLVSESRVRQRAGEALVPDPSGEPGVAVEPPDHAEFARQDRLGVADAGIVAPRESQRGRAVRLARSSRSTDSRPE